MTSVDKTREGSWEEPERNGGRGTSIGLNGIFSKAYNFN